MLHCNTTVETIFSIRASFSEWQVRLCAYQKMFPPCFVTRSKKFALLSYRRTVCLSRHTLYDRSASYIYIYIYIYIILPECDSPGTHILIITQRDTHYYVTTFRSLWMTFPGGAQKLLSIIRLPTFLFYITRATRSPSLFGMPCLPGNDSNLQHTRNGRHPTYIYT